jgi:hypothetical protein
MQKIYKLSEMDNISQQNNVKKFDVLTFIHSHLGICIQIIIMGVIMFISYTAANAVSMGLQANNATMMKMI